MTEELGIWKDRVVTPDTPRSGVYSDITEYKLFDSVNHLSLYSHITYKPVGNDDPLVRNVNAIRTPEDPVGLIENNGSIKKLFEELKTFILENPKYIDVLYSEIDGFSSLEWYLQCTADMNEMTDVFHDIPLVNNMRTSWNNVRMLWYLKNIHENIRPVREFDNIIDFGAGTGHFIKHCYQVGFKGSVQIVDLPTTVPIQKYVLRGLDVKWVDTEDLLTNLPNTLFNSTWGLSETPISLRDKLPDISSCSKFIAFQHNFFGVDNKKDIINRFYEKDNSILRDISIIAPWDGGSTFLLSKSFI